ncbi:hypothetical protein ACTOJ1_001162 [Shigella flexneri]
MTSPITKTIKEIKDDIGVHFSIDTRFNSNDYNKTPPFSTNNFLKIWINNYNKNFKDHVEFLYAVFSGEYKKKGLFLEVNEHFCINHVIAATRLRDRGDLFFSMKNVKESIKRKLLLDLDVLIYNKDRNFMVNAINKNNITKKVVLKTSLGKKLDYLIRHRDMLKNISFDSLMNVNVIYEYEDENKKVFVPENWDTVVNDKGFNLNFVSFEELSESKATLYSAFYDKKANAMSLTFETETQMAYNYQQLDFDVDYNEYVFSNPGVYLTKDEAKQGMLDIITGYEEKIAKIKAQLS